MKYYQVTAKCGHVGGKGKYIENEFYTAAENAKKAAEFVRLAPRVKHHHKDAIRNIKEISFEEYLIGQEKFKNDPYNTCKSSREQKTFEEMLSPRIQSENLGRKQKDKHHNLKRSYKYGYENGKINTRGYFAFNNYEFEFAA